MESAEVELLPEREESALREAGNGEETGDGNVGKGDEESFCWELAETVSWM